MDTQQNETDDNTFAKEALICEVGVKLEKARQTKGLSKEQVLKELKFNVSFLDALESGQWSEMPGEVYALGFLRQYAELLGVDVSSDIERIKTNTYELTTPLTYPDAPISPNRTWAMIAALLFILGMIISNLFNTDSPVSSNSMPQPSTKPTETKQEKVHDNNVTVDVHINTPPQKQVVPSVKDTDIVRLNTVKDHKDKTTDTPKNSLSAFTFIAVTDDVWLQIYEQEQGKEPKLKREALLRVGQSFSLDSNTELLLTSGKPTALKVLRDGEVLYDVGTLGKEGKVLKLFQL
ncbi:helix-turn-helix domain-containing protein [Ghiorsea bivora]|uniref:helix-turn-helix domain-containing protein n=1 Tax=Ghiorsea bivora TaxID=1485545 RepID=UPI00056EF75E|nr:helix-turn-helix domain-containing protein [Ghiorsea bivora]